MISPGWSPWGRNRHANTDLWTQQEKERVGSIETVALKHIHYPMVALFLIAKKWKQLSCPSNNEWNIIQQEKEIKYHVYYDMNEPQKMLCQVKETRHKRLAIA